MILKSFEFQCDFDFQITTSKIIWILILNHLYLGDLILKSTYDDFAHLCIIYIIVLRGSDSNFGIFFIIGLILLKFSHNL